MPGRQGYALFDAYRWGMIHMLDSKRVNRGEGMTHRLRMLWADNRKYVYAAGLLLLIGALLGFVQAEAIQAIAQQMLAQLQEIVEKIREDGGDVSSTFWTIFWNNLRSSLTMMGLGLFFAIMPIFGLLSNGMLLGFILAKMAAAGINPWMVLIVGILPHGILELPAVVFAAALGIRLGLLAIRSIGLLFGSREPEEIREEWRTAFRQLPLAVLSIAILLFVAAGIESVITPQLIKGTMGTQLQWME